MATVKFEDLRTLSLSEESLAAPRTRHLLYLMKLFVYSLEDTRRRGSMGEEGGKWK
jgi:hypothetical protein